MVQETMSTVARSVLEVVLTVTNNTNGTKQTYTIREGQTLKDLVYVNGGVEETISGIVKVIGFNYIPPLSKADCVHVEESNFSKCVLPTTITIDCSTLYDSDIRVIKISAIRSFTIDDPSEPEPQPEMEIANVAINGLTVTFDSNIEVATVNWNGEDVIPELVPARATTFHYKFIAPTMLATNVMKINGAVVGGESGDGNIKGPRPVLVESTAVNAAIKSLTDKLVEDHYDKHNDGQVIEIADDAYYVAVATGVGATKNVTINGTVYSTDVNMKCSLGKNAFAEKPIVMIKDGTLYLAAIGAMLFGVDGNIAIGVNGFELTVPVNAAGDEVVKISSVNSVGIPGGYNGNAELTGEVGNQVVNYTRDHGHGAVGIIFIGNEVQIPRDSMNFSLYKGSDNEERIALSKLGADGNELIYNYWLDGPVTQPINRTTPYTAAFPGHGVIKFTINFTESVKSE